MTHNHAYQNNKACELDMNLAKFQQSHPNAKKILLECGQGIGSKTFTSYNNVSNVPIDKTCLNGSEVLIKSSSIISIEKSADGVTIKLRYELFKMCNDEEPQSLGVWTSEKSNIDVGKLEGQGESFSSISCECIICPECCNYFVTTAPVKIEEGVK